MRQLGWGRRGWPLDRIQRVVPMRQLGWVAATAVLAAVSCTSDGDAGPDTTEAPLPEPSEVTLSHRDDPAVVPLGETTFVWGGFLPWDEPGPGRPALGEYGDIFLDAGAILAEGATGTAIPPAPFPASLKHPEGVAVDGRVVVVGSTCAEAADNDGADWDCRPDPRLVAGVHDPATRRWRELTPPPELADRSPVYPWIVGATDTEVIIGLDDLAKQPGWWAVDPTTDAWRQLPAGPYNSDACVAGDRVVRFESSVRLGVLDLAGDDGDGYVRSAEVPIPWDGSPYDNHLTCAGDTAVVTSIVDTDDAVLPRVLDLITGEWTLGTTSPPFPYRMSVERTLWTGDEVLVLDSNDDAAALAYAPATDTWRVLAPPGFDTRYGEWSGDAVVAWDRSALHRWVPVDAG